MSNIENQVEKNIWSAPSLCFRTRKEYLERQIDWIDELEKADEAAENNQKIKLISADVERDIRH